MKYSVFGEHRVIKPKGVLPQPAWKIDNTMKIYPNELLIQVETLNIDSASFTQIRSQANDDVEKIKEIMKGIVAERGKHHNPKTGSGGMLIGTVKEIGDEYPHKELQIGDRIATLVSLSLTPLMIDEIIDVKIENDQVDIKGEAILFASGIFAKLPEDMPKKLALSVLDVAGAPAQTARLVKSGQTVAVIGASGKSGLLCLHEAKKRVGVSGKVIALCYDKNGLEEIKRMNLADEVIHCDATDALTTHKKMVDATNGILADLTINCVNIPNTEMATILSTKDQGTIYFFSMATSFTAAALGAEGVGKDVNMIIGNGYCKDHAKIAIEVLRENSLLRDLYNERYA
jgi:L-erythro-3,5-diaminohexanoate dehydrogenase